MILRLVLLQLVFLCAHSFTNRDASPALPPKLSVHLEECLCLFSLSDHKKARSFRSNIMVLKSTMSNSKGPSSSLKSAAIPLLDSGKALARTGELLIDLTSELNLYGGALSAVGAGVRNAGDNIAQAAASCRFKTGNELVIDEIREAALSLSESTSKLQLACDEAKTDQNDALAARIGMFCVLKLCISSLFSNLVDLSACFQKFPW